jgi:hypothetical protein
MHLARLLFVRAAETAIAITESEAKLERYRADA